MIQYTIVQVIEKSNGTAFTLQPPHSFMLPFELTLPISLTPEQLLGIIGTKIKIDGV